MALWSSSYGMAPGQQQVQPQGFGGAQMGGQVGGLGATFPGQQQRPQQQGLIPLLSNMNPPAGGQQGQNTTRFAGQIADSLYARQATSGLPANFNQQRSTGGTGGAATIPLNGGGFRTGGPPQGNATTIPLTGGGYQSGPPPGGGGPPPGGGYGTRIPLGGGGNTATIPVTPGGGGGMTFFPLPGGGGGAPGGDGGAQGGGYQQGYGGWGQQAWGGANDALAAQMALSQNSFGQGTLNLQGQRDPFGFGHYAHGLGGGHLGELQGYLDQGIGTQYVPGWQQGQQLNMGDLYNLSTMRNPSTGRLYRDDIMRSWWQGPGRETLGDLNDPFNAAIARQWGIL